MNQAHTALTLTPRSLYLFLRGKVFGFVALPVFSLEAAHGMTLNKFWQRFLEHFVDAELLQSLFDAPVRLRSVSTMMNRSEHHSCPRPLFDALEKNLTLEKLVSAVAWLETQFSKNVDPVLLLDSLTQFEKSLNDLEFTECYPFFSSLHIQSDEYMAYFDFKLFLCAVRITWLSLHALYGDEMSQNISLRKLRSDKAATPSQLWQMTHIGHDLRNPEKWIHPTSAANSILEPQTNPHLEDFASAKSFSSITLLTRDIQRLVHRQVLPHGLEYQSFDGWYAVANWTDLHICLSDLPQASYKGSSALCFIPNGTVLYVVNISEYNGLHNTPAIWGYTEYNGINGYVPMDLLIRIHLP